MAQRAKLSSKKKQQSRQEPPFSLYADESNPTFEEGWASVVRLLRGRKNIAVLTGAGMSVACGIPDFRSKGSGLYSTLDTEVCVGCTP
jgi:Sir2 family